MLAPQEIESVFLRPSHVASRRFRRTTGGYDPEDVHQFLEDVADYLSRLEGELEWRRARRTRVTGTIGEQREAINVVTEAREQAERIVAEARKEAEGFMRLARAIAHQLALEAQARRPHVALAVTRASGSSTTLEGNQELEDLEVWVDASVFDLTKIEESETSNAADDADATAEASTENVAAVESAATPESSDSTDTLATPENVPTADTTASTGSVATTETAAASEGVAASPSASSPEIAITEDAASTPSDGPPASGDASPSIGAPTSDDSTTPERKPGKKKKKSKKKF